MALDLIYPERCPVCKDVIPLKNRMRLYEDYGNEKKPGSSLIQGQNQAGGKAYFPGFANGRKKAGGNIFPRGLSVHELYPAYVCDVCLKEIDFITRPYCQKCGRKLRREGGESVTGVPMPSSIASLGSTSDVANTATSTSSPGPGSKGASKPATSLPGPGAQGTSRPAASVAHTGALCTECQKRARAFAQTRCVMTYDELARQLISDFKYKGQRDYAGLLSLLTCDKLGDWIKSLHVDALVPVPVHAERLKLRGYNQAELIACGIGSILDIPVVADILFRVKNTTAQKSLGALERLQNLKGAFKADLKKSFLNPGKLLHKPVLLVVDDIFTTGMTLNICSEALLGAGAGKVYGVCIAAGSDIEKNN